MPNFEKNIKALLRILSEDRRRILAIYYDNIITADKIEKIIDQAFPNVKKKRIRLSQFSQEQIVPQLREQIRNTGKGFLYIYDLEHAGFVYSNQMQSYTPTQFLTLINLQREKFFADTTGKVIFFVNKAFLKQIKESMADFWDWIFYHFEFSIKDFETSVPALEAQKPPHSADITKDSVKQQEKEIKKMLRDPHADNKQILTQLVKLIENYISEGRATYATEWINKATKIARNLKEYDIIAHLYEKLANYYIDKGHWKKAEKYLSEAMEVRRKHLSNRSKELGELFNKLGHISKMLGNLDKAREYYSKVARQQLNSEKVLDLAQSYCDLAKVFIKTRDYNKALEYAKKSLELRKKVLSADNELMAQNFYQIAKIYYHLKKNDLTKTYLDKARKILKKIDKLQDSKLAQNIEALYENIKN